MFRFKLHANVGIIMDFSGRIAYYSDHYVQVLKYNTTTKQSLVCRLSLPNELLDAPHQPSVWVKTSSLRLYSTVTFSSKFPTVISTQASRYPVGFISDREFLDFTNCVPAADERRIDPKDFVQIQSSCRFIGEKQNQIELGSEPLTSMPVPLQIWAKVGDIVEIEDLDLSTSALVGINCFTGKNIFFRRCKFVHATHGVCVAHGNQVGRTNGALKATFESCTFSDCEKHGLVVGTGGEALLLNCTFVRCRVGIHVVDGGKVEAKHCTFTNCRTGTEVSGRGSSLDILYSVFSKSFLDAAIATDGACLYLAGSRFVDSKFRSVTFRGPKRTFGRVTDCVITKCDNGVVVEGGKNDVILKGSDFTNVKFAILVLWDVVGYVDIIDCTCQSNVKDLELWHGERCALTINDNLQPSAPLVDIQFKANQRNKGCDLEGLRLCKNAGITGIQCFHCHTEEPADIVYKKCKRCKQSCYCSKECQVQKLSLPIIV